MTIMNMRIGVSVMRWRQVISLAVILIPATLFTVPCGNGLRHQRVFRSALVGFALLTATLRGLPCVQCVENFPLGSPGSAFKVHNG
jgi:hypothetical protein